MWQRGLATVSGGRWGATASASDHPAVSRPERATGTVATPWAKLAATPSTVTTRMEERLRERRSASRRLLTLKWAKRAGVLAGVAGATWLLLLSPVFSFDADNLEASGFGTVVDPAEVQEIVAQSDGKALALVNVGHVQDQLEELVGVREATVERVWPSGLRVTLASSEPVAAIPLADGTFALVDDGGVQVAQAEAAPSDLPILSVPLGEEDSRILDGVIAVVDEMPAELRERIQDIEAQTEDSIHFVLRDGPAVEWGSSEQSALKAEVLLVLLKDAKDAKVIDVSAPTLPTVS